jgi:hypothetical protein
VDTNPLLTCVYCPRLCRHACPVVTASGREAATPNLILTTLWRFAEGKVDAEEAAGAAALCTGCGACTAACKHHRPVAALIERARGELGGAPEVEAPGRVEGGGELVAVETDERRWAEALEAKIGRKVARFRSPSRLGARLLPEPERFAAWARALRDRLAGRGLVVADHDSLRAARAAELRVSHLLEILQPPLEGAGVARCCGEHQLVGPPVPFSLACCGAAEALGRVWPETAADVAKEAVDRLPPGSWVSDARCGAWLRQHGGQVRDPVEWLIANRPVAG